MKQRDQIIIDQKKKYGIDPTVPMISAAEL